MAKPKPCLVNILKIWVRRRMSRIFWPIFLNCMYYPLRVYLTRKFRQDNRISTFELESPLLGGDLGVGKAVIRKKFTEIFRPRNPPLTPPKRGIAESPSM